MKRKLSLILVLILVLSSVLPSMAFAGNEHKVLNMTKFQFGNSHARFFYDLPYGLWKKGENLPYGLLKKGEVLPLGLQKEAYFNDFEFYVYKMLNKYDASEELRGEIEALLEDPDENKEGILELLDELEETFELDEYIEWVRGILEEYEASADIIIEVEELLEDDPIDKEAVQVILDQLIDDFEALEAAMELYDVLIVDIKDIIEDKDFEWPDEVTTGASFMITFNAAKSPVPETIEEYDEVNFILQSLLDYLLLEEDMYTITEGLGRLDVLSDIVDNLLIDLTFGTGAGEYFESLETMLRDFVVELGDFSSEELIDIIVLINKVEEVIDTYEEMRYITTDEYDEFVTKKAEVLDYIYNHLNKPKLQ